jgi:hypothetical protein
MGQEPEEATMRTTISFQSTLAVSPEAAWAWVSSFDGFSKEMAPILRISAPRHVKDLTLVAFEPGVPMFRSWLNLFGVLPVDYSDLTLLSLPPGIGFVEQSRMGSMKLWRQEREINPPRIRLSRHRHLDLRAQARRATRRGVCGALLRASPQDVAAVPWAGSLTSPVGRAGSGCTCPI